MSAEKYIKENVNRLATDLSKVYRTPDISEKKLNGAISAMAPGLNPDYVLAIADTTLFGGAREGCLFTGDALYIHSIASKAFSVKFGDIASAEYQCSEKTKDNGLKKVQLYF